MVGIIQEQHPDRARLFMQWKQMGWPILVDSLNLLEVSAVPITLAIDEHGIIRHVRMRRGEAEKIDEKFLSRVYDAPAGAPAPSASLPDLEKLRPQDDQPQAWSEYANALMLWEGAERLDAAIEAYDRALRLEPGNGWTHFRLGVAHRRRYDSEGRAPGDFAKAVEHWSRALDIDPNQYIWRRRIQQYGPRLDKPYPFYDWVVSAREEIAQRGEMPVPLRVEPGGAEFATPARRFAGASETGAAPDPEGRIRRDEGELIHVETVVVPDTSSSRFSARVHLVFRPDLERKAHWNNEVDDLLVWVPAPEGWQVDLQRITLPNPPEPVTQETRRVEFELRGPRRSSGPVDIPAYALYYVCEDVDGSCLYSRQDLPLRILSP